jgi:SAM-dependent methyltransferase
VRTEVERASLRDPDSRVFYGEGRVFRGLTPQGMRDWEALAGTGFFQRSVDNGRIVRTWTVDEAVSGAGDTPWAMVLEHQRLSFVSYPYEWTFGMLRRAAILHLEILLEALAENMSMKDGTPYNVQWEGTRPVFIDVGSFFSSPGGPWAGYRQFCEMVLNPLFLQAYRHVDFHAWLRGCPQGIGVEDMRRLIWPPDFIRAGVVKHVVLHAMLQRRQRGDSQRTNQELVDAGFGRAVAMNTIRQLLRLVNGLTWRAPASPWTDYAETCPYAPQDRHAKLDFVSAAVRERRPGLVVDLGCNDGAFSRVAAEAADYVVAVDRDHATVERLYRALHREGNRRVLPLVVDLGAPRPRLGWRGSEHRAFGERCRPDLVLCLALVHHLSIDGNVPIPEVVDWLRSFDAPVVVEFPSREDPMVRRLLADRPGDHADYSCGRFEAELEQRFSVEHRESLPSGSRTLYVAVPR